jgi:hypothetical protein
LTVVVVFPTPPFWFITAIVRMRAASVGLKEPPSVQRDYLGNLGENKRKSCGKLRIRLT